MYTTERFPTSDHLLQSYSLVLKNAVKLRAQLLKYCSERFGDAACLISSALVLRSTASPTARTLLGYDRDGYGHMVLGD